jgi:hypothetical protein
MTAPRIYLVTNDAARCALELWCHPGNLPPSVAVVDNPDQMLRIPDGVSVRCYWYGTRDTIAAWESWWTQRRLKGGFEWVSQEDWERVMQWAEKSRKAPCLLLNQGIGAEEAAETGSTASSAFEDLAIPEASIVDQPSQTVKRGSKWT